jgi:hypothetical protein
VRRRAGGGGTPPAPWFADTNKDFVATKGWKTGDDAISAVQNLEKLVGADKAGRAVIWPKDENDKDGWKAIQTKLGVPEDAKGYELKPGESDGDAKLIERASGWFHARGIPKGAAQGLLEDIRKYGAEITAEAETASKHQGEQELAALKTEWGTAYDGKVEGARRFAQTLGINAEQMSKIESVLGTASFMKMFDAGGKKLGEAGGAGRTENTGGGMTQMQARERLEEARQKRSDGKMTQEDWFALSAQLNPIAYPQAA